MTLSSNLTKRHLCDTLMRMCERRPLQKITVSSLIAEAGCARQTFYNHFKDINDLIHYIPINFLEATLSGIPDVEGVRRAYTYALEHPSFFTQLPQVKGQNDFRSTFSEWLRESLYEAYIPKDMKEEEKLWRRLSIDLYCYGVTEQFLEWCRGGLAWPLEVLLKVQEDAEPDFLASSH